MTLTSEAIADNDLNLSKELDECFALLNSAQGKSRVSGLNTICEKLAMTSFESPNILKVMLVWPHWYRVLFVDPVPNVRRATREVHSALRVLVHPMNPETKKLSRPWIAWCYWALNKNAPSFVQEAFRIIYPQQKVLDAYHKDLVDTLHFNLHSPNKMVDFVVQCSNNNLLGLAIASIKTFTVLITHLPTEVLSNLPKLVELINSIWVMHQHPMLGCVDPSADCGPISNPLILLRLACFECIDAVYHCAPFLLTVFVPYV